MCEARRLTDRGRTVLAAELQLGRLELAAGEIMMLTEGQAGMALAACLERLQVRPVAAYALRLTEAEKKVWMCNWAGETMTNDVAPTERELEVIAANGCCASVCLVLGAEDTAARLAKVSPWCRVIRVQVAPAGGAQAEDRCLLRDPAELEKWLGLRGGTSASVWPKGQRPKEAGCQRLRICKACHSARCTTSGRNCVCGDEGSFGPRTTEHRRHDGRRTTAVGS